MGKKKSKFGQSLLVAQLLNDTNVNTTGWTCSCTVYIQVVTTHLNKTQFSAYCIVPHFIVTWQMLLLQIGRGRGGVGL